MASASFTGFDNLPPELLETIFGLLDLQTLCTARLVGTQFRGAASRGINSVELSVKDLRSRPETTLNNFPNLSQVCIFDVTQRDLPMLSRSPVADAVTHLRATKYPRLVPRPEQIGEGCPLLPLPNLVSLTVRHAAGPASPFPQTLRELTLEGPVTDRTASLVASLTNLTCLQIDVQATRKPFEAVTALTALQRLDICTKLSLIPFVAELTLLTHLQFRDTQSQAWPEHSALVALTRLHRLVHVGIGPLTASLEHQLLASIGTITSLRSLDLRFCLRWLERSAFETVCMTPFSQLTALRLECDWWDAAFLPRFNLERLQDLSLPGVELTQDAVAALRRATALTHLHLYITDVDRSMAVEDLWIPLSRMSRLRALSIKSTVVFPASFFSGAIRLLTELTTLECTGWEINLKAAAEVCLGLKKLRVLSFHACCYGHIVPSERITPETLLALATLPELRTLDIRREGADFKWGLEHFMNDIQDRVNAERHSMGWPPLQFGFPDPQGWG